MKPSVASVAGEAARLQLLDDPLRGGEVAEHVEAAARLVVGEGRIRLVEPGRGALVRAVDDLRLDPVAPQEHRSEVAVPEALDAEDGHAVRRLLLAREQVPRAQAVAHGADADADCLRRHLEERVERDDLVHLAAPDVHVVGDRVGELGRERPDLAPHPAEVVQQPRPLPREDRQKLGELEDVYGSMIVNALPPYSAARTEVVRLPGGETEPDELAVEEPLEIRVDGRPIAVTMRTPGHDEELAIGFLRSEGIPAVAARPTADLAANTIEVDVEDDLRVPAAVVSALPDRLREAQPAFAATGGLHATGLFDADGGLLCVREDVGRHNAMDKVIGRAFLDGVPPLDGKLLCVSGRLSFELVQKAAVAGCPVLVAVGAPSTLAVELARDRGITLCGFVRGGRLNVYSEPGRIA